MLSSELSRRSSPLQATDRAGIVSPVWLAFVAVSAFCLVVYALSLARLHAVWFDFRFGLVALGVCVFGLGLGAALHRTALASLLQPFWLAAIGPAAAAAASALVFLTRGHAQNYLAAIILLALPFTFWVLGTLHLQAEPRSRFAFGLTGAIAAIVAALVYWALFALSTGPLVVALFSAIVLGLAAMATAPRSGLISLALTLGFLGQAGVATDWAFSPVIERTQDVPGQSAKGYEMSAPAPDRFAVWDRFSRLDLVGDRKGGSDLRVYENGVATGIISSRQNGEAAASRRTEYPLVALTLYANLPRTILLANAHGALEFQMAFDAGVAEVHWLTPDRSTSAAALIDSLAGDAAKQVFRYSVQPARLPVGGFDAIYLTIPRQSLLGSSEPSPAEEYRFTTEAFREYWARLKPGGMLVILAGEQVSYVRALIQAWEALPREARITPALANQAWGFRTLSSSESGAYEYLGLIAKGRAPIDLGSRLAGTASGLRIAPLFGPGVAPAAIYAPFAHPRGMNVALPAIGQYLVRQTGLPVDIFPATDDRPFFFQTVRELHPYFKWLVGISLAVLAYAFLIPLAPLRRLDHPDSAIRPPVPLYLAPLAIGPITWAAAFVALVYQSAKQVEPGDVILTTAVASFLGLVIGLFARQQAQPPGQFRKWLGSAVGLSILAALAAFLFGNIIPGVGHVSAGAYLAAAFLLAGIGTVLSMSLLVAARTIAEEKVRGLDRWTSLVQGTGALLGAVAALWIAQYRGWSVVWWSIVATQVGIMILGLLLGQESRAEQVSEVKTAGGKRKARR